MKQPFSPRTVLRILSIITIFSAILAGYYQTLYDAEVKRYLRLEDKYVRVRSMLGREETQRLIDLSYQSSTQQ